MRDEDKSKDQLIAELIELRKRIDDLETMQPAQLQTALTQLQQEISERYLAEQALRGSENKFRLLFERFADAIILYTRKKHIDCNQAALEMFRCSDKKIS